MPGYSAQELFTSGDWDDWNDFDDEADSEPDTELDLDAASDLEES